MSVRVCKTARPLLAGLALALISAPSMANTLNQNVSWTIDRSGTTAKYRVVAYGDSIYAGYNGSTLNAAKYSAPTVEADRRCRPLAPTVDADEATLRSRRSGIRQQSHSPHCIAHQESLKGSDPG